MTFTLASHFLAGSILTLVLPVALLVGIGMYWWLLLAASGPDDAAPCLPSSLPARRCSAPAAAAQSPRCERRRMRTWRCRSCTGRRRGRPGRGARRAPACRHASVVHTSVVTFMDPRCTSECPIEGRRLASVLLRLPAASRPTIVDGQRQSGGDGSRGRARDEEVGAPRRYRTLVVLGSHAAARAGLAGLRRSRCADEATSCTALSSTSRPAGNERTGYLFPFLPSFVQRDLATLARERAERRGRARAVAAGDGARGHRRRGRCRRQRRRRPGRAPPRARRTRTPPLVALVCRRGLAHRHLLAPALAALARSSPARRGPASWPARRVRGARARRRPSCSVRRTLRGEPVPCGLRGAITSTLTKPRIMSLLLVTGFCGLVAGAHGCPVPGRSAADAARPGARLRRGVCAQPPARP